MKHTKSRSGTPKSPSKRALTRGSSASRGLNGNLTVREKSPRKKNLGEGSAFFSDEIRLSAEQLARLDAACSAPPPITEHLREAILRRRKLEQN